MNHEDLRNQLHRLHQQNYKAYKEIKGDWEFPDFRLRIDHVQGDPFAAASKLRIFIDHSIAGFPAALFANNSRAVAFRDYLTRAFYQAARGRSRHIGTGKGGLITIDRPGQQILDRSSCLVHDQQVEVRFIVGLPANGRRILGREAAGMLCGELPAIVDEALCYASHSPSAIEDHVNTAEDADVLRGQLEASGLVAFVADGSCLPRRSGIDDRPLGEDGVVLFQGPESLRTRLNCPHTGTVEGMGIPHGITLIVGGGYHGKSTLLGALERGVYNHVPGDGREKVVTLPTAVKIRAEDGRQVSGVRIDPFINNLPGGRSTRFFSTPNASGSTSQAANIVEAMEAGSRLLLVDEDTSATNFMIRDRRMQELIRKSCEPITPFTDKIRQIHLEYGVSTILVMGGSGDYFDPADRVIAMESYRPSDVTAAAKDIAQRHCTGRQAEGGNTFGEISDRGINPACLNASDGRRPVLIKTRGTDEILLGRQSIDLSLVEQLVDQAQLRAIGYAMAKSSHLFVDGNPNLREILDGIMRLIREQGIGAVHDLPDGDLALFRPTELAAAINRLRSLKVSHPEPPVKGTD